MKRLLYFSVSVLCLALAALIGFHIGSRSAEAQDSSLSIAGYGVPSQYLHYVILSNGDVYYCHTGNDYYSFDVHGFVGNFFDGEAPVNASESTWGNIKNQLKK